MREVALAALLATFVTTAHADYSDKLAAVSITEDHDDNGLHLGWTQGQHNGWDDDKPQPNFGSQHWDNWGHPVTTTGNSTGPAAVPAPIVGSGFAMLAALALPWLARRRRRNASNK